MARKALLRDILEHYHGMFFYVIKAPAMTQVLFYLFDLVIHTFRPFAYTTST